MHRLHIYALFGLYTHGNTTEQLVKVIPYQITIEAKDEDLAHTDLISSLLLPVRERIFSENRFKKNGCGFADTCFPLSVSITKLN